MRMYQKQPCLKPQDLVVALKVALAGDDSPSFARLARELFMSASETHAAAQRAIASRLLEKAGGSLRANRASLQEFVLYGVKYAFPATEGPVTRGVPTGACAPHLRALFDQTNSLPSVWPDAAGEVRGPSLRPLYPTVPAACRLDEKLYAMLSTLDALRGGAAREREVAQREVIRMLS
jgi:hypothetical protein